jgi:hypothetical protein
MWRIFKCVLVFAVLHPMAGFASGPTRSKKIAVSGNSYACEEFGELVVKPAGFQATMFAGIPIPIEDFPTFRAIVFSERDESAMRAGSEWTPEDLESIENYVKSGGTIVFCRYGISTVLPNRSLGNWSRLTGFASYPDAGNEGQVELTSDGLALLGKESAKKPTDTSWAFGATPVAEGITSAEELAILTGADGTGPKAFITRHKIGDGQVFFVGTSLNSLSRNQAQPDSLASLASFFEATLTAPR